MAEGLEVVVAGLVAAVAGLEALVEAEIVTPALGAFVSSLEVTGCCLRLEAVVEFDVEAAADDRGPFVSSSMAEGFKVVVEAEIVAAA